MSNTIIRRLFSQKLVASPRFTVVGVPADFVGQRLDRYLMTHFKLPWAATQKMVRSKHAFVVLSGEVEKPEVERYVYRDPTYTLKGGDEICLLK